MAELYPHLSFYPSYQSMSSGSRWQYLEWLSHGRPGTGPESFQLQFLKGLERRAITDGQDQGLIWGEVWRMWSECGEDQDSLRYATNQFLWYLLLQVKEAATPQQLEVLARVLVKADPWNVDGDRYLSLLVGWCAHTLNHLPIWMAYHTARVSHEAHRTVVVTRAEKELRKLFALRFREKIGPNLPLPVPARAQRYLDYLPTNKSVKPSRVTWADPLQMRAPWKDLEMRLARLYNSCLDELRPLALALGKGGSSRRSVAAWESTPPAVRRGDHPALQAVLEVCGPGLEHPGQATLKAKALFKPLEIPPAHGLTIALSRRLATSVRQCGLAIEPDSTLSGRSYRAEESVVLFRPPGAAAYKEASHAESLRYVQLTFLLGASYWIKQEGSSRGLEAFQAMAALLNQKQEWTGEEIARYQAYFGLLQLEPPTSQSLKVPSSWSNQMREEVASDLKRALHMLGPLNLREEKPLATVLKKLSRRSGESITALTGQYEPVLLSAPMPGGAGELLPPPPLDLMGAAAPLQLNHAAVAALMEETRSVQARLAEAMAEPEAAVSPQLPASPAHEPEDPGPAPAAAPASSPGEGSPAAFVGLDERFVPLLELWTTQDSWPENEARQEARRAGLMLGGALEAINDWAIEQWGTALLYEEGDTIVVERELLS